MPTPGLFLIKPKLNWLSPKTAHNTSKVHDREYGTHVILHLHINRFLKRQVLKKSKNIQNLDWDIFNDWCTYFFSCFTAEECPLLWQCIIKLLSVRHLDSKTDLPALRHMLLPLLGPRKKLILLKLAIRLLSWYVFHRARLLKSI